VVEGEPSVFGAALATLLADPEARARLGSAGRSKALADFSWPVVADQMDALYHSVCET
jgi:glycosyltransferase involved in cell wall biosynthesis